MEVLLRRTATFTSEEGYLDLVDSRISQLFITVLLYNLADLFKIVDRTWEMTAGIVRTLALVL